MILNGRVLFLKGKFPSKDKKAKRTINDNIFLREVCLATKRAKFHL